MSNVSPGVYTKIIDLSSYVADVPGTIGFLPIISERGPDNQLVFTNGSQYFVDFGRPNINYVGKSYGEGPYVAESYLRASDALYVIRCLPTDAAWSNMLLTAEVEPNLGADTTADITASSEVGVETDGEITTIIADTTGAIVFFYGIGRGEWYNDFQIKISQHVNTELEGVYVVDIYQRQEEDDFVTGLASYEITETYEISFDYRELDDSGESMFIEDVINRYSTYIRCQANQDNCLVAIGDGADFSQPFSGGPVTLNNGDSGSLFDDDGAIVSDTATQILTQAYNGTLTKTDGDSLEEVLDVDDIYFSLVLDGGYPLDVKNAGIYTLTTTRQDCVGIIDNGDNVTIQDAIDAREDDHTYNTRYMALYEPFSKIYDSNTGRDIWVTPVVHMANVIPNNDKVAEIWYAAAGFNRATVATIKEMRFSPLVGDRDRFYLHQINPIVKFNVGYTVWGQLTTQKKPSALQDLNIIRLVLYVKRAMEQFSKFYIFEQNDAVTWSSVKVEVNRFLKEIQNKRGLTSYSVEVAASDYELKSKQFHINIILLPTKAVEKINLNFYIT